MTPRQRQHAQLIQDTLDRVRTYLEVIYLNEQGFGTVTVTCKPEEIHVDHSSSMRIKMTPTEFHQP